MAARQKKREIDSAVGVLQQEALTLEVTMSNLKKEKEHGEWRLISTRP